MGVLVLAKGHKGKGIDGHDQGCGAMGSTRRELMDVLHVVKSVLAADSGVLRGAWRSAMKGSVIGKPMIIVG